MEIEIHIPEQELKDFCRYWQISELAVFGSVLREDFNSESDVDLLASFDPEAGHTLFDMVRMRDQLQNILGRRVDLVSRKGVENSRNTYRKRAILESARVIYGS